MGRLLLSRSTLRRRVACFQSRSFSNAKLDLPALDRKWREAWASMRPSLSDCVTGDGTGQKKYILPMFPYPSGHLHLGHLRVYTIADVIARFHTLNGHRVIMPMGWDAFGLPAENAAMERGIHPATWTKANITRMKEQLELMNGSWDWSREVATCDAAFYKHTQKIFLLLHEKGLAYQAEAEVNYDPVDKTVLANEQVDSNGCSWRSGAKVEKVQLKQWFLRITEFREALLKDLSALEKDDGWPARVLAMQKNWLGKSVGAMIKFPIMTFGQDVGAAIEIYTTRPETLFGVQYIALASTHPIVQSLAKTDAELQAFIDTIPALLPDSKVGYLLPHLRAVNPLAYHEKTPDHAKKSVPVYVAPYVLGDYGEGAVMGVPGHDVRDHAFWKQHHYDEPVRLVLSASGDGLTMATPIEPFVDHGTMTEQSGPYKGKSSTEAGQMLVSMLEAAGLARPVEKWRLRDWLISRQRYWGTPIPIIHCMACGDVPVPDHQLPVTLPDVSHHWTERRSGNPLESLHEWINVSCPRCGGSAKRDTDTMDTFVDSSWYYMRFVDAHNEHAPFSAEQAHALLPVDVYVGGIEHAILHLLYARFIYKFLMTSSLVTDADRCPSGMTHEPFSRLITQGMVHGKTYSDPSTGRFLKPGELDLSDAANPTVMATGEPATVSYEKMSKSKHNGVDPTEFIAQYGADATRSHMLFQAPVGETLNWDEDKISGVTRWLSRVYQLVLEIRSDEGGSVRADFIERARQVGTMAGADLARWETDLAIWRAVQIAIGSVTASYNKVWPLNTVVSDLMRLTNTLETDGAAATALVRREALSALVRMVAPIAPAFAEECWSALAPESSTTPLFSSHGHRLFPVPDGSLDLAVLQPRTQSCAVQINGKFRFAVAIPRPPAVVIRDEAALAEWVTAEILSTELGAARLPGENVAAARKVLVVKEGRLVNYVL